MPPSLSSCSRHLAQQAMQTGPIVKAQRHSGGDGLWTYDNAIDPLQCSEPGLFPLTHNSCGETHNAQAELKQSNFILTPKSATGYLQHWVPGTRRGRSCSSWYEYCRREKQDEKRLAGDQQE